MPALPDPFVFTQKTPYMQRVQDLVRSGHTRFVQGEIPISKAAFLADKFNRLYDCQLNKLESSRARKLGRATSRLLFLYTEGHERLLWILLVTDGKLAVEDSGEKWRDPLTERITLTGYELVRTTKPVTTLEVDKLKKLREALTKPDIGLAEKKKIEAGIHKADLARKKAFTWTWRYTRQRHDDLREAVVDAIRRKRDDELRQLIHTIWRTPGFSGARAQAKKFRELITGEWQRSRGKDPQPEIPDRLGYVRRLPDVGKKLSAIKGKILEVLS